MSNISNAFADIGAGLRISRVWIALASENISNHYRRTILGPLWLLINYLAFVGAFVFVFERGDSGMENYIAYVATGLLVWFYIMETIIHSSSLFVIEQHLVKGTNLPISVYVMQLMTKSVIRAGYALLGCLAILLVGATALSAAWGWSVLGIAVILATTPAAIIVFAFIGAYFPDSQLIVTNLMRVGMFLTPVFWVYKEDGGIRGALYNWNPFTYYLEIVRAPVVTGALPLVELGLCLTFSVVLWITALQLLGRYRRELVFLL